MNGKERKFVKEIFEDIVKPEIKHIHESVSKVEQTNKKQWDSINKNRVKIAKNETNIKNIKFNFKNNVLVASLVLTFVGILVGVAIAFLKK